MLRCLKIWKVKNTDSQLLKNMQIIKHRINDILALRDLDPNYGAEIDVRYHEDSLILHHDPFSHQNKKCVELNNFLENWNSQGPLILNIKTEGIESQCINMLSEKKIVNWFFLDLSMPYFVKYSELAKKNTINSFSTDNLAVRFSDFEPIEYAIAFAGKAKWVWVDTFNMFPLNMNNYRALKNNGFKICLVSPELQNHPIKMIDIIKKEIIEMDIDAVCTKQPSLWI
jgi:hypothetical protein